MEHLQDFALDLAVEVDQQVAADDQVDLRERRIRQQVVLGEQHPLADLLAHAVVVAILKEVLTQPGRGHVGNDRLRVSAVTARSNGTFIDVGGKHLQLGGTGVEHQLIADQHRQGIGLFAGGAARRPQAYLLGSDAAGLDGLEQAGQHIPLQGFECFTVTKEVGHADQQVAEQGLGFIRMVLQVAVVGGQIRLGSDLHPPFDTAQHRGAFVVLEIMAGTGAQLHQNVVQ